ncbi:MAG: GrpB family protein [Candidatus Marinimicrobia bacterium]|nr:GrpB family protein [bacterium]MCG2716901.1 GrpB family protein [Candidatus Neomarinimicrobiota bacterium]
MKTTLKQSLEQRIAEVIHEEVAIVPYNPDWLRLFDQEAKYLWNRLPKKLIIRIEHFGSTAIPGLVSKPIIDILVEVTSLEKTKKQIVPLLKSEAYEYFWRPEFDKPPMYAWFIKRNSNGERTHHIHMVEADSKLWDRLYFRDYLREFPEEAKRYSELKLFLSEQYPDDRVAYTKGKTNFIVSITEKAKLYYNAT